MTTTPPIAPVAAFAPRIEQIQNELQNAAHEYATAKMVYDTIRIRYEVARESFARIKEMASERMSAVEWVGWQAQNPTVKFAATQIGPAVIQVLEGRAWQAAGEHLGGSAATYWPYCTLDTIVGELEKGGFDFSSTAPKREVNAALINLGGVVKYEPNWYAIETFDSILEQLKALTKP